MPRESLTVGRQGFDTPKTRAERSQDKDPREAHARGESNPPAASRGPRVALPYAQPRTTSMGA
jgi:hypothetical protein